MYRHEFICENREKKLNKIIQKQYFCYLVKKHIYWKIH